MPSPCLPRCPECFPGCWGKSWGYRAKLAAVQMNSLSLGYLAVQVMLGTGCYSPCRGCSLRIIRKVKGNGLFCLQLLAGC